MVNKIKMENKIKYNNKYYNNLIDIYLKKKLIYHSYYCYNSASLLSYSFLLSSSLSGSNSSYYSLGFGSGYSSISSGSSYTSFGANGSNECY